jgi:hypothetical protein
MHNSNNQEHFKGFIYKSPSAQYISKVIKIKINFLFIRL